MIKYSASLTALAIASWSNPCSARSASTTSELITTFIPASNLPVSAPDNLAEVAQDDIIVTGTRQVGTTAAESAAPIKLLSSDALIHVGQPNLNQVLTQLVPSFTAESFGGDAANLTLSAALRGLSPNQTLVLVNGKRRHGTANVHVLASPFQGGAAPDLDFITPASIDHVEVLEDGASAQYGSDAIAGVINIILKKKSGGTLSSTGGAYYGDDGQTFSTSLNAGIANEHGFFNATGFYRYHNFSNRGEYDMRVYDPTTGTVPAGKSAALTAAYLAIPGYPNVNYIIGDARSSFGVASYNAGYDVAPDIQLYSFGSIGFRKAESYENVRLPDRVVGTNARDPDGTFADGQSYDDALTSGQGDLIARPEGFEPQEAIRELDYATTGGLTGETGDWRWDLSTTYGRDRSNVYTLQSINRSRFWDFHYDNGGDQSDFYDGKFIATEWTTNLDISRKLVDLATLSAGFEYRKNSYEIVAGEPNSYYKTGAQSFPGYSPSSAGKHKRHNFAFYGDVALTAVDNLQLDGAVRYEDYSDFGSKATWKVTGRYDFTPEIAVRGTVATGFRAPTLAEEFYTQVNVSPTSAFVQIAANSPAAKVLGIQNLRPETSTNYSLGFVFRPVPHLTVTVDAYQIKLKNRIVGSAEVDTKSPSFDPNDLIWQSIVQSGYSVEDQPSIGIVAFVNGPDTRTRGVDLVASYDADLGDAGRASLTLSGAYNDSKITRPGTIPAPLVAFGSNLFDRQSNSFLTTAAPDLKLIAGVNWTIGAFSIVARETYYTKAAAILNDGGGLLTPTTIKAAGITDLEVGFHIRPTVTLAAGANNLFDKRPERDFDIGGETASGGVVGGAPLTYSPYGINGGYYYGRISFNF